MTGWRVEPAAVTLALRSVGQARDGFEDVTRQVARATGAAVAATPGTETADVLAELASDPFGLDVEAADQHVRRMAAAVGDALGAFEQGDQTMADLILHDRIES